MHTPLFFKLFPPPKLLAMPHAGLDISDDAVHIVSYSQHPHGLEIASYGRVDLPAGLIEGGDISDDKVLGEILSRIARDYHLLYVKVSVPEEKSYLFQTDVPGPFLNEMRQNIEFKIEENVPLSAADAVFYFDLMPSSGQASGLRASVSVASRDYIERYSRLIQGAGMQPVAFEVIPKAIARILIPASATGAKLIIHIMSRKTGIYIVFGNTVCFTSTVAWGSGSPIADLSREIERVYSYWASRDDAQMRMIGEIILVGRGAASVETTLKAAVGSSIPIVVADVWKEAIDLDSYVPPILRDDSLEYAVAAGLALP